MNDPRSGLTKFVEDIERSAYQRGVDETRAEFDASIREAIRILSALLPPTPAFAQFTTAHRTVKEGARRVIPRAGSDQLKVYNVITGFPGQRGVEIYAHLQHEVEERTVRTALHRLKKRGAIFQNDGKWYAAQKTEVQKNEGQPAVAAD